MLFFLFSFFFFFHFLHVHVGTLWARLTVLWKGGRSIVKDEYHLYRWEHEQRRFTGIKSNHSRRDGSNEEWKYGRVQKGIERGNFETHALDMRQLRRSGDENSKGGRKDGEDFIKVGKRRRRWWTENWERDAVRILRPLGVTITIKGRLKKTTVFLFPLYFLDL